MSSTMEEPKSVAEMIGEMLREASVLVLVFVPLDVVIAFYASLGWREILLLLQSTLIVGTVLGLSGLVIERRRARREVK